MTQQFRRLIDIVNESFSDDRNGVTLYHGTLKELVPEIKAVGLQPSVGEFTKRMYDEYVSAGIEMRGAVFAANLEGIRRCVAAIGYLVEQRYTLSHEQAYGPLGVGQYGALCIIKGQQHRFAHWPHDEDDWDMREIYHQAEPGDYMVDMPVKVDEFLVGDQLVAFLRKHNAFRER